MKRNSSANLNGTRRGVLELAFRTVAVIGRACEKSILQLPASYNLCHVEGIYRLSGEPVEVPRNRRRLSSNGMQAQCNLSNQVKIL
jgi:hypothetical protein